MPVMAQLSLRFFICCLMPWVVVMAAHSESLAPFSKMSPGSLTPSHRDSASLVWMSPILCQHHQWNYDNNYNDNKTTCTFAVTRSYTFLAYHTALPEADIDYREHCLNAYCRLKLLQCYNWISEKREKERVLYLQMSSLLT